MDDKTLREYRNLRTAGNRASQALRMARYKARMVGEDFPRYYGDKITMELPRGESIVMVLEPDHDADIDERLNVSCEDVERYSEVTEHAHDGWIDRNGRVLFDAAGNRSYRYAWQWWTDNYGFAQFWEDGKREHSRHDAWLRAREMVAESFNVYREAREDGYVGYVVTLHDADGDEVDSDSCGGFEATGDYAGQEAFHAAESMAKARAKYWEARAAEAKRDCIALRKRFSDDASEYRFLRTSPDAARLPSTCEIVRDRLVQLRARHRDALRVVTA